MQCHWSHFKQGIAYLPRPTGSLMHLLHWHADTLLILNVMATSRKTSSASQASGAHMQTLEGWASQDVFLEDLQGGPAC